MTYGSMTPNLPGKKRKNDLSYCRCRHQFFRRLPPRNFHTYDGRRKTGDFHTIFVEGCFGVKSCHLGEGMQGIDMVIPVLQQSYKIREPEMVDVFMKIFLS